jgi:glycosyltransferase involved in cell wall biosynthesis
LGNGLLDSNLPYDIIPNIVRPVETRPSIMDPRLGHLPRDRFFLFVGDIERYKGVRVLLDAYASLRDPPPLVLIGKLGPDTPARFPAGVRVLVDWPNDLVQEAWRRCLAAVVPSVWPEPFGLVATEAMAAGRPVVASRIGGIPDIVTDGVSGILVRPADPRSLAGALRSVASDDELEGRLARGASVDVGRFAPNRVLPRLERAYETAAARSAARETPRSRQR